MTRPKQTKRTKLTETEWMEAAVLVSTSEVPIVRGYITEARAALNAREWDTFIGLTEEAALRCKAPLVRRCLEETLACFPARHRMAS